MYSVGLGGDGYVRAGVDEKAGGSAFDGLEDVAGEGGEGGGGEVFFAELDEVDALFGPDGGLADEGIPLLGVIAEEEGAVSDGAAEHVDKCSSYGGMSPAGRVKFMALW